MADDKLKELVVAMIKRGMSEDDIKKRLEASGLQFTRELYDSARQDAGVLKTEISQKPMQAIPSPAQNIMQSQEAVAKQIPNLKITSVSQGSEKTVDIGEMLGKDSPDSLIQGIPKTSISDILSVERKLDDLNAKISALETVNKQILATLRDLMLKK